MNFSLLPYSEPDQDVSPNNDPDWDWGTGGGGKQAPGEKENNGKKVGLTESVLTDTNNVISRRTFNILLDALVNTISFRWNGY